MKNMPASVRGRLLNIAKKEKVPFQRLLTLYNQEGLLHRIALTEHKDEVVLKGGLFFYQLQGVISRPTKDIDLLGKDNSESEVTLHTILSAASTVQINDGLEFDQNSIDIKPIAGQTEHGGIRGTIIGYLGTARTRIQIDMGFGDVVVGGPVLQSYRTLLENRSFSILMYSDATVAAEKLEAVISLGIINSRYKDLFDLFELLVVIKIPTNKIVEASIHTFRNRMTSLPEFPESLSDHYWASTLFSTEWYRFLHRIEASSPDLNVMRNTLLPRLRLIYEKTRREILKHSKDSEL